MEDEEVIRRRMAYTRDALTDKLETLEQRVSDSVAAVSETVANVQEKVQDTVASVQEKVHEGVESVKDAVDVPAHVDRHPWLMLGGSLLCGYVLGNILLGQKEQRVSTPALPRTPERAMGNGNGNGYQSSSSAQVPASPSWLGVIEPELQHLKGLALGATLGTVRELLTEQVPPHMAGQLRDIIDAVTRKVGGEPVPSSDWNAEKSTSPSDASSTCNATSAPSSGW